MSDTAQELIAYQLQDRPLMPIVPASKFRPWMDAFFGKHPYHCLPLLMANQAGWFLLNPFPILVRWNGGRGRDALQVRNLDKDHSQVIVAANHFGGPVLTWLISYIFRTPLGYNLLVRGPANWVKPNTFALEGLVETDWHPVTFTMNWIITRPNEWVLFEKGEPICMIVPQKRHDIEAFQTRLTSLSENPEWADMARRMTQSRRTSNQRQQTHQDEPYEGHYFQGVDLDGNQAPDHQTRLNLAAFSADWPQTRPPGTINELRLAFPTD